MVEPPPAVWLPVICPMAARDRPRGEKPLLVQNSRSSAATIACFIVSGISSNGTTVRLPSGEVTSARVRPDVSTMVAFWLTSGSGISAVK